MRRLTCFLTLRRTHARNIHRSLRQKKDPHRSARTANPHPGRPRATRRQH